MESEPEIWRSILIPSDFSLKDLHVLIQLAMGWEMEHLYEFRKGKEVYGRVGEDADDYGSRHVVDDGIVELSRIFKRKGSSIQYLYDFGDNWLHNIELEKILPEDSDELSLLCIGGERACPPEDVGGIGRYNRMVRRLEDPAGVPKDERLDEDEMDWLGDDLSPSKFNCEEANERIKEFVMGDDGDGLLDEGLDEDLDEDLWGYDPNVGPDAKEWLELDETEQMLAAVYYHRTNPENLPDAESAHMHAVIHACVETQIAGGSPTITRATMERLTAEGMDRHEAIHAIGAMLAEQIYSITKEQKPFDELLYRRQLTSLNRESWRAYCERIDRNDLDS